ncbi:multidrug transporter [Enterococcus canintestini]|uniref:Multidrug transporter n=2 Tax=Enterococcus canintestini TaxID=317010 RepID=A0A1L8R4K9_9ENTE|nr:multidrug transporter [Enterococcus canintestini]
MNAKVENVIKIADGLNMKAEDLMNLDDNQSISTIYNKLEPPRQKKVYRFAEHQLEEQEKQKQNSTTDNNVLEFEEYRNKKIISGRLSAAGTPLNGDLQDSEASVMIVDQREVPKSADEIVTIAGDSMEPLLHEGEQVFIQWTPVINQGEIALVSIVDEGVTCKKVYWDDKEFTLHSINEDYEDMTYPLSDVRIIGKVL